MCLLRDPEIVKDADVLLLESTYGNRDHRPMDETLQEFEDIIVEASQNGGNILIPSFAVGRTQEIIFRLGQLYQKGLLRQQAVYLDSPMAIAVAASIHTLGGFSAHASQSQLLDWINHFSEPRPRLYLVHGEADTKRTFQQFLADHGWTANIPQLAESIDF